MNDRNNYTFYSTIANLPIKDAIDTVLNAPKIQIGLLTVNDLQLNGQTFGESPLINLNRKNVFGYGVYIAYKEGLPCYVGQTNKDFLDRISVQLSTAYRPGWGWNSLLRKVAAKQSGKNEGELSEELLKIALEEVKTYSINRIVVDDNSIDGKIARLERYMMKSVKEWHRNELLNNGYGKFNKHELTKTLAELL